MSRSVPYEHAIRVLEDEVFCEIIKISSMTLMIKRELMKNEKLKDENWERFLPNFKKKIQSSSSTNEAKKKKKRAWKKKGEYTPFPPAPTLSKIDKQLESGEYFMTEKERLLNKKRKKIEVAAMKSEDRKKEKLKKFQPPVEKVCQMTRVIEAKGKCKKKGTWLESPTIVEHGLMRRGSRSVRWNLPNRNGIGEGSCCGSWPREKETPKRQAEALDVEKLKKKIKKIKT
ncbi:hypothetical protein TELCIR_09511 [Teladorsagia circumcincta]|uniref:Uncharacterized protein n=1 Tax=Teladorsagia circumcincta TaxID=45464 RepID=A0A2G9UEM9_TELCI|nr:hypothetical protein TELCIR_09511 [Teladorsagia circumcincta]